MSYFDGAYNNTFVWADVEASRHDMLGPQRYMSRKKGSWQRKADGFAVAVGRLCGGVDAVKKKLGLRSWNDVAVRTYGVVQSLYGGHWTAPPVKISPGLLYCRFCGTKWRWWM